MRYATCLKGAALAASVLAAGVLMNGPASADVYISGYAAPAYEAPAYGAPVYYTAPAYGYYNHGPIGSPEAAISTIPHGYAMPVAGPYAYRYATDYYGTYPYRGYIPADDQSFSDRVDR